MSEGDIRVNIGINLDEVDGKLEALEQKLIGLPDVKANVQLAAEGVDTQLSAIRQRLQRKAGNLGITVNLDNLEELDQKSSVVRQTFAELVEATSKAVIAPKADSSEVRSLAGALSDAIDQFELTALALNTSEIKPRVDLSELLELNKELDRKQRHWVQTGRLLKQRPLTGKVSISTEETVKRTHVVQSSGQATATVVQAPPGRPIRPHQATQAATPTVTPAGSRRALPPARAGFFDRDFLSDFTRGVRLLLSTKQSRSGVMMSPTDTALEELVREQRRLNRQLGRANRQQMFRYDPPLSDIRQQQGWEDYEKMVRKSGYSDSEIDRAFRRLAEKNRRLESGEPFSEVSPSLLSSSRYKFYPPSQSKKTFKINPEFRTETVEDGRALHPAIQEYIRKRNERLLGNTKLKEGQSLEAEGSRPDAVVSQPSLTPSVRIQDNLGINLKPLLEAAAEKVSQSTSPLAVGADSRDRQVDALGLNTRSAAVFNNAILKVIANAFDEVPQILRGGLARVKREILNLDPERFQYKLAANAKGEVGSLRDVTAWNENLAGVLSVWRDPKNGKTYVINGHNRLPLAERLGIDELNVRYIDAKTAEEARAIGALENIASGHGTVIDAGKFFRDSQISSIAQVKALGLPLSSGKAEKGLALGALPREIFNQVLRGEISVDRASILGGSGLDEDQQREALKFAGSRSRTSNRQLQEYIDYVKYGIAKEKEQPTILGMEKIVETDLRERVAITEEVKTQLSRTKRLFSKVAENADVLSQQGGNIINVEENEQIASIADKIGKAFDQIKFTSPEITRAINEGIERLRLGEKKTSIVRDILPEVTAAVEAELDAIFGKAPEPVNTLPAGTEQLGGSLFAATEAEPVAPKTAKLVKDEIKRVQEEILQEQVAEAVSSAVGELTTQDVTNSEQRAQFAKQQQQAALIAGDERGAEAWGKELRQVQRDRLAADMARQEINQAGLFGVGQFDTSTPLLSNVTPVQAEVVSSTPFDDQSKPGSLASTLQGVIDAMRQSDARFFAATANQLFESKWGLGGNKEWQGLSKEDARASYVREWAEKLSTQPKALPGSAVDTGDLAVASGSISDAFKGALERLKESDERLEQVGERIIDVSKKVAEVISDDTGAVIAEKSTQAINKAIEAISRLKGVIQAGTKENPVTFIPEKLMTPVRRRRIGWDSTRGSIETDKYRLYEAPQEVSQQLNQGRGYILGQRSGPRIAAQEQQQKLYEIRLGKRELEGLQNVFQLDIPEDASTKAFAREGIILARSMKLTARQLAILAKELTFNPTLDDISSLQTQKELEAYDAGKYLLNAKNASKKIIEQARSAGLTIQGAGLRFAEQDAAQESQPPKVSALEAFASLVGELKNELEVSRPYKPSSRMFGGSMSEWTEDQQRQYKEAQSSYRVWDKQQKLVSGLSTAVNYNDQFRQNFTSTTLEGLAGIIEQRKGGLTAKTTSDLSNSLTSLLGRNVPDTRKELAKELRSLTDENAELFIKGILDKGSAATEAGARLGYALIQGIKSALQMKSPSKVLLAIGKEAALSFLMGWEQVMNLLQGRVDSSLNKVFDYAVKTPAGKGVDYSTLTGSIADLTIDPPLYQKRLESVGLQNMPSQLLSEASARGTFQDFFPEAKIERVAKQLPGTLERLIDGAFTKSFNQYSSSRFVGSNLAPTQAMGTPSIPENPGIRQKVVWDGLMARDGQTGRIISRREGLLNSGKIAERVPTGIGSNMLPLFDTPGFQVGSIPDPWYSETGTYRMQAQNVSRPPAIPTRQLLLPPAARPEPSVSPIFDTGATTQATSVGSFNFGTSQPGQARASRFGVANAMNAVDSFIGGLEAAANKFRTGAASVKNAAKQTVDSAQQFVANTANPFRRGGGGAGGGIPPAGAGAGSTGGGGGTGSPPPGTGSGVTAGLGGPGRPGGPNGTGQGPSGPVPPSGDFAFNDWLDSILPDRGTGTRQDFELLNSALGEATRSLTEFTARYNSARSALDEFTALTNPNNTGRQRTQAEEDYLDELQDRADQFEVERDNASRQRQLAQLAVQKYGTTGDPRAIADAFIREGGASRAGLGYTEPGEFSRQGLVRQTLNDIRTLRDSGSDLRELFSNVDTRPIDDVNIALAAVQRSLQAIRDLASSNLIDDTDLIRAEQGARRLQTSLQNQAAETVGYAADFEALGIQSEAALRSTRRVRDEANRAIQASNLSDQEKARANNARDIQELSYLQEQIRGAQGASGFGGFRGREIGDEALNQTLQRTQLMNFRRNLEEARRNMQLAPDPAGGFLNQNSYATAIEAIDRQITNADRAFRVLNGTASDGERAFETMRNAFGVFSDDLGNLIPQLIAFDFAFNIIYSTLLPLPRVVLQTTAEFDRLQTSIESFLLRTRNMTDASKVIDELKQQSLDLGIGFEQAAQSYLSLAAALQGTRLEGQEEDISRTLLTAGRGMGLGQDQLSRTTAALTQIVGKGTLQMEELRQQLAEQMPGALQIAARAFGVTTRELYQMVSAGEIAGDEFVEKFIAQLKAEGADVNAVANSFASLQDQLGSAMQQMAAVAGQPLFTPLTLGLKLLVETVKALIPLAGLLSVGILAVGANMAKTALGIGSWRRASGQLLGAGVQLAQGNRAGAVAALAQGQPQASPLLGANGQPLQRPGVTPVPVGGQQGLGISAGLKQTVDGLKQSGTALKNVFGQAFVPMGGGPGRLALGNLQAMKTASAGLGAGLKDAAKGAYAMGAGLTKALAPILKLYLAIEGISLIIKTLTGDLNKLDGAGKAAEALGRGEGDENAPELNRFQRFLSKINPASTIGRIQEDMTAGRVTKEVGNVYDSLLKDGQKYSDWRKADAELQLKEDRLLNRSKQDIGDDERKRIDQEIKQIREARKEEAKKLPYSPSAISSSLNLIEQTRDNRESQITRLLRIEGVGEQDIGSFISGEKQLSDIPESDSLTPVARERVESYMKEIKVLGELEEGITSTTKALELFDRVRGSLPTSLTAIDAEIQKIQEQLANEDLSTTEGRQAFDAGSKRVQQLNIQREILSLTTEQQNVRVLQDRANAEQAVAAAAQVAGQARLEILEAERSLLETINELQQKRRQLSERKVQNQVSVSREIGFTGDALRGERELIALQNRNRQAEIRDQRLLINSDRQRAAIERDMRKAELRATQAQLIASSANADIDYQNMKASAEAFMRVPSPESQARAVIFGRLAASAKAARDATNAQAGSYEKLISNADRLYDITQRTAAERANILDIERQMANQDYLSQQQINFIQQQRNEIESRQRLAEQQLATEERAADIIIQSLQEKIQLTEEYLSLLQREQDLAIQNASIDRDLVDERIQVFRDRNSDGFFTRMSAYDRTGDADLLELGRERRRLMEEVANRQQSAALLTLDIDKQRLAIEQEIFKLEQQKARIALATQRVQLTSQIAILELQLNESIKADEGRNVPVAPERIKVRDQIRNLRAELGIATGAGTSDPNGVTSAVTSIGDGLKLLDQEGKRLEESTGAVAEKFRLTNESISRVIESQKQLIEKQRELSNYEVIRWWNEFLDSLGGLGTVLSEATAGLSEFRRSVAEGIARGLREGGTSEAISNAAGRLSDRIIGSIVDEFLLKPMEENLFRGIKALLGPGFGPAPKPEEVIAATEEKLEAKIEAGMKIDSKIEAEIRSFHTTFKQKIDGLFDKTWQPPAGPEYTAPAMGGMADVGSGAFDTGLKTGPGGRIGAGAPYHQDIMFGRQVSMQDKVRMMDELAKGYEAQGRVIEFSNKAVENERYRSTMSYDEKASLIQRAEAAHMNRPGGSGRPAMDFYAPLTGQNRFGSSVEGQSMLAPVVPGAQISYGSGGNYGNHLTATKNGQMVFELGHGDQAIPLPQNRQLPAALAVPPAPVLPQQVTGVQPGAGTTQLPASMRTDQPADFTEEVRRRAAAAVETFGVSVSEMVKQLKTADDAEKYRGMMYGYIAKGDDNWTRGRLPQEIAAMKIDMTRVVDQMIDGRIKELTGQAPATGGNPTVAAVETPTIEQELNTLGGATAVTAEQIRDLGNAAQAAGQGVQNRSPINNTDLAPGTTTPATGSTASDELNKQTNRLAESYAKQTEQGEENKKGMTGLNQAMRGAVGVMGSLAMGFAGIQQMQQGGTYNTLMGLSGIFGAVGSITGMFTPGGSLFSMFRANGGPVNARQPYIVGERGPELFMPETGGSVVSNNDTNSLFKKTRAQLEANRRTAKQVNELSFESMANQPIDVRFESTVINGVEYVTTEQLRVATREAAERGRSLTLQSIQGSVRTRRRLNI